MPLLNLKLQNLGPFRDIEFEFDKQVNLFVGPNNCGKSTVLWALADIAVNPFAFPEKLLGKRQNTFSIGYTVVGQRHATLDGEFPITTNKSRKGTAEKSFWSQKRLAEIEHVSRKFGYSCFIPALRRGTDFRARGPSLGDLESLKDASAKDAFSRYASPLARAEELQEVGRSKEAKVLFSTLKGADPMQMEDSEVIQAIVELDYRAYRENRPEIHKIIEKIGSTVSEITEGFPVEFVGVGEDEEGLFPKFKTCDGEFPLNTLSQGTQSLVQWLGHFLIRFAKYYDFPKDLRSKHAVLIIDEIDAHLHPAWQRRMIPVLTKAFPQLQIFCSSHSPLMPAGLRAGQVHLLSRDAKNRVVVARNTEDIDGWSSDEILRGLMGVSEPVDLKTTEQLERLQLLRRKKRLSKQETAELESLRKDVGGKFSKGPATEEILTMVAKVTAPAHSKRKANRNRTRRAAKSVK